MAPSDISSFADVKLFKVLDWLLIDSVLKSDTGQRQTSGLEEVRLVPFINIGHLSTSL